MQPGGRPPAPAWLRLLQDFVNTYDIEAGQDSLDSQERLHDWLKERGLIGEVEPVTDADLGRTLDFREALRELLLANGGEPIDPSALDVVNAVASGATLTIRFLHGGGAALEPAAGASMGRSAGSSRSPLGLSSMAAGPGSKPVGTRRASGRSTTVPRTALGPGARCRHAETG